MYGTIYLKAFEHVKLDDLKSFLIEYETNGLLFVWAQFGKKFGYFPGPAEGRLVAPSKRYNRQTPEPHIEELREYCSKFNILNDAVLNAYPTPTLKVAKPHPLGSTNYNNNSNKRLNRDSNNQQPVDNSVTENDLIVEKIDSLREKLGKVYWSGKENVHKWTLMQIKLKTKAKAILFTLMAIDEKRPDNPWGYADTVLENYNDHQYNKKDNIFTDIVEKLKKL
jgi:hypothetical protein